MAEKQNVNVNLDHSNAAFFSDGISLFNRKDKFFIDFRQTSPRIDMVGEKQHYSHAVKHSTIVVDPIMAKALFQLLKDSIGKYEKEFGKIELPKQKKVRKGEVEQITTDRNYIG